MAIGTGMLLMGKYRVGNKLGENAVGETFAATDLATNERVVVKELRSRLIMQTYDLLRQRGANEGIVKVYDVFSEGGANYAVMEFVAGMTLEAYLSKSNSKFNIKRMKDLMNPVINSLASLADSGVCHGNISADNFIFTNQGKLKLIGFGHMNGIVSPKSRPYASVEMYDPSNSANELADVYGISTTIYRCITGVIPAEALQRRANDTCAKPQALGIPIDEVEESALWVGMNPNPANRVAKLSAFYRALYNAAPTPTSNLAVPPTPVQPTPVQPTPVRPQPTPVQPTPVRPQPAPQPTPVPPTPVQPRPQSLPNSEPINTQLNTNNGNKKGKKKSGGSPVLIILIIIGIIVAIVLGVVVFGLATNKFDDVFSSSDDDGDDGEGDKDGDDGDGENKEVLDEIQSLMDEGNFEDAIQSIIDNDVEEEDGSEMLQNAIDNLYSQCVNEANALADMGDLDNANATVDNRTSYFADVKSKLDYTGDTHDQELADLKDGLSAKYVDYYKNEVPKQAAADDEEAMKAALDKLSGYMDEAELKELKESNYCTLITVHSNSLSSAKERMDYIDAKLSECGNASTIMELWDNYDNSYYSTIQGVDRMKVTTVRTTNGYVIPNSDTMVLNNSNINTLSEYELYFGLYEIYARHGRNFADNVLNDHFNKQPWYHYTTDRTSFSESELSDIEKQNVQTILDYCRMMNYRS
jgi:serine/threonine protein kinase